MRERCDLKECRDKALLILLIADSGENPWDRKRMVGGQSAKSPHLTSIINQETVPVAVSPQTSPHKEDRGHRRHLPSSSAPGLNPPGSQSARPWD